MRERCVVMMQNLEHVRDGELIIGQNVRSECAQLACCVDSLVSVMF